MWCKKGENKEAWSEKTTSLQSRTRLHTTRTTNQPKVAPSPWFFAISDQIVFFVTSKLNHLSVRCIRVVSLSFTLIWSILTSKPRIANCRRHGAWLIYSKGWKQNPRNHEHSKFHPTVQRSSWSTRCDLQFVFFTGCSWKADSEFCWREARFLPIEMAQQGIEKIVAFSTRLNGWLSAIVDSPMFSA